MLLPSDVPELVTPSEAAADEAEVARCPEEAARVVQNFADAGGSAALCRLHAAAGAGPGGAGRGRRDEGRGPHHPHRVEKSRQQL